MIRGRVIAWITVAIFLAAGIVICLQRAAGPSPVEGRDEPTGVSYSYRHDRGAIAGDVKAVLIGITPASGPGTGLKNVRLVSSTGEKSIPAVVRMYQLDASDFWAGVIPAAKRGETARFYFVVETGDSKTFTIPAQAAENGRRFESEFKARPASFLNALLAISFAGSVVLLLHGLYFAVLFLAARFPDRGGSRHALYKANLLALIAIGTFSVVVLPLAVIRDMVESGSALEGGLATAAENPVVKGAALAVLFACLVMSRTDLLKSRGDPRSVADLVYAILYVCACILAAAAAMLSPCM